MVVPTTAWVAQEITNELRILQTVVDDMDVTEGIRAVVTRIKNIRVKFASGYASSAHCPLLRL